MTKLALQRRIEALQNRMTNLKESGIAGTADAFDKAMLALHEFGEAFMKYKNVTFREDPNLDDDTYFRVKYVKAFEKIEKECLAACNAALVAAGRKPLESLAA